MRLLRQSSAVLFLSSLLFISEVTAQGLPTLTGSTDNAIPTASSAAATSSASSASSNSAKTTSASDSKSDSSSAAATSGSSGPPSLSSSSSSSAATSSGLPKLPQNNYPAAAVPNTSKAPYQQKSNLPEGTVFICVGAALGFLGLLVLLWRGLVAWSLHRSVRRSAIASSTYGGSDAKSTLLKKPSAPFYSQGPGSTLSLEQLGASHRAAAKSTTNTPRSSLFFSPTAGTGMHTPGQRGSGYLPAGYYASGTAAPGGGSPMTHIGGGQGTLSNPAPQSHGYSRARHTPPDSPSLPPSRGAESTLGRLGGVSPSTSSVNLSVPEGRVPSAYLEDLLDADPGQVPRGSRRYSRRA